MCSGIYVQYSRGGDSQLVGKKMEVTRQHIAYLRESSSCAALSPRSVGGELRSAWSSGRAINTSDWMSEGKRPHPTTCPVLLYPCIRMFITMKDEKDEFCVQTGGKETTVRDKHVQYIVASLIKGFSRTIQDTVGKQWSNVSWLRSPQDQVQMSELSIHTPYFM